METTNLSKIRRNKMLNTINEIKKNITDEETLTNLSMIENELIKKKYGLIWEEHEESIDKDLETKIPTFEEENNKKIISNLEDKFNFLLEGDNLHSLYLLEKTHKEKIDIIYIDPPYNTGSQDFIYNDEYIDSENEYKHSKWLSFMSKRLNIAKKLLDKNGIIFISIDDNELYSLKLLCDEIFGDNNYLSTIVVESGEVFGTKAAHVDKTFVKVKDYVLIYAKDKKYITNKKPLYDSMNELYDSHYNTIVDLKEMKKINLINYLKSQEKLLNSMDITINKLSAKYINDILKTNEKFKDYFYNNIAKILYTDQPLTKKLSDEYINSLIGGKLYRLDDKLIFKTNTGSIRLLQSYSNCLHKTDDYYSDYCRSSIRGDLWKNFHIDMRNIDDEGNIKFKSGKKPIRLIKQLLKWYNIKNATILDFFAGSGTTAQAVLELNKEDNGNRNFILCTNNENNICENITYKRIKNVIEGYGKYKPLKANLKYYKCSYIPRINNENENLHNNLLINIKNLIQLENGIEIDDNKIKIYLNEDELDKFSKNQNELDICEKVYISSDILLTSIQESIFKNNNIEVYIIPEYYFEDEIMEVM